MQRSQLRKKAQSTKDTSDTLYKTTKPNDQILRILENVDYDAQVLVFEFWCVLHVKFGIALTVID